MVTPLSAEMFNVRPEKRDWVNRRCVPQPLATFEMPILLSSRAEAIERRIFILADDWDPSPFRFFAKKYENATGWQIMKMRCGHSIMVDMPGELAAVGQTMLPSINQRTSILPQNFLVLRRRQAAA